MSVYGYRWRKRREEESEPVMEEEVVEVVEVVGEVEEVEEEVEGGGGADI